MPKPKKPAALTSGHNESQSEIKRRMEDEAKIKGSSDEVDQVPDFIQGSEKAEKYYGYIYGLLKDTEILSDLDRMGVGALAECLAMMEETNASIFEQGPLVEVDTKYGTQTKENPAINTHIKYLDRFRSLSTLYGLSPSSRAQLSALTMAERENANDPLIQALSEN